MFVAMALLAAASAPPATASETKKDPIICHAGRSEVGTHMRPKPVCMKKSEWELVENNTQTQLNRFQDRSAFAPGRQEMGNRGPQ